MPLYEYQCEICEHDFEVIKSVTDKESPPCPECESKTRKKVSAGCITGFSTTGYSPEPSCSPWGG